jgi:hypothetical protein
MVMPNAHPMLQIQASISKQKRNGHSWKSRRIQLRVPTNQEMIA